MSYALDVWLAFDDPDDEMASHEANTFPDGDGYRIDWYHVDVGQVRSIYFDTLAEVHDWYEREGYHDFTS